MKVLTPIVLLFAMTIAACVPIPVSYLVYVPHGSGVTVLKAHASCQFSVEGTVGQRVLRNGVLKFQIWSWEKNPNPHALLSLRFERSDGSTNAAKISVNPKRILLEENGTMKAAKSVQPVNSNFNSVTVEFPVPSGVGKKLRVIFQPGAVSLEGRAVSVAPLQFNQLRDAVVGVFPCIPT